MSKQLELAEAAVKMLIKQIGPKMFVTALNNASCHGKVFIDAGFEGAMWRDKEDKLLGLWYEGVQILAAAAKQIES